MRTYPCTGFDAGLFRVGPLKAVSMSMLVTAELPELLEKVLGVSGAAVFPSFSFVPASFSPSGEFSSPGAGSPFSVVLAPVWASPTPGR